jgi:NAD+ diphosphatase
MITGFVEEGERPEDAVVREVAEELGLRAETTTFVGHFSLLERNQLIIAYGVAASGVPRLSSEIAELKTVSKGELVRYDFGPLQLTSEIVAAWLRMST